MSLSATLLATLAVLVPLGVLGWHRPRAAGLLLLLAAVLPTVFVVAESSRHSPPPSAGRRRRQPFREWWPACFT